MVQSRVLGCLCIQLEKTGYHRVHLKLNLCCVKSIFWSCHCCDITERLLNTFSTFVQHLQETPADVRPVGGHQRPFLRRGVLGQQHIKKGRIEAGQINQAGQLCSGHETGLPGDSAQKQTHRLMLLAIQHNVLGPQAPANSQPQDQTPTHPDASPKTQSRSPTRPRAEPAAKSRPQTQARGEEKSAARPKAGPTAKPLPQEPMAKPQPQGQARPGPQTQATPKAEPTVKPEPQTQATPKAEPTSKSEPQTQATPKAESTPAVPPHITIF
uniref:Uncharacterized protein n=1 Tax=Stegastes partitus TaxID=144197 RepID=A0A3B4ZJL7_9TELE